MDTMLVPPWLEKLLTTSFFGVCLTHGGVARSECNMFCLDCCLDAFCFCCKSSKHNDHRVIQIRRSSYHDVVRVSEVQKVLDVSGVQTYVINSAKVLFINERPQTKAAKVDTARACCCEICRRSLLNSFRFCSLGCKRAITLTQQLAYYKEWQNKVLNMVGKAKADNIVSNGIHLISSGTSDFIQNYYINPMLNGAYTPDQFSDILLKSYSNLIQNLYNLRARRIGVTSLPPMGCLPASITLFGSGTNQCVPRLNQDAVSFKKKLNSTSQNLKNNLPGLKLVVFDIYNPLLDMIAKPIDSGFFEARKACCGTGTFETSYLCNERSVGTCSNAKQYVFWDGFHPSEAANEKLAQSLLEQGFDLIS